MSKPATPVSGERLMPQDIEAEQAVLGGILIDPDAVLRVAPLLEPEDFYREENGWVYEAALALHERHEPVDSLTLCGELERAGRLDLAGGLAFVTELINATPTSVHTEHYAHTVEQAATRRRMITATAVAAAAAYDEKRNVDECLAEGQSAVLDIARRGQQQAVSMSDLVRDHYDRVEHLSQNGRSTGIPTGFEDLDSILGGMQDSDVIVLAARPSMGKTSLALNVAHAVAGEGVPVAFFSLEMSDEQLVNRVVAAEMEIDTKRLRDGDVTDADMVRYMKALGRLESLPLWVDDTPGLRTSELRSKLVQMRARQGIRLAVVDYLQLMRHGSKTQGRYELMTAISQEVKAIAKEVNIPILALSQLSRAVEGRADKRPLLSDLRESGGIEQDADVVVFIYRDEVYNRETEWPNIAETIVAKHRNGPTGVVNLYFKKTCTKFVNAEVHKTSMDYEEVI